MRDIIRLKYLVLVCKNFIIDLFCDFRVPYISSTRRKGLWS